MTEIVSEYLSQIPLFILTGAIGFLVGAIYTWTAAWSYSEHRIRKMTPLNRAVEEYQLDEEYRIAETDREKAFMKVVEKLKSVQNGMRHNDEHFESNLREYSKFVSNMSNQWQVIIDNSPGKAVEKPYLFKPQTDSFILEKVRFTGQKEKRRYRIIFEEGFESSRFKEVYWKCLYNPMLDGMYISFDASYENLNAILVHEGPYIKNIWEIFELDHVSDKWVKVFIGDKKIMYEEGLLKNSEIIEAKKNKKKKHDSSEKRNLLG